ncbi:MAG: 50S ribosomal protein L21 [Bacteroidia bacterium]|nr:50S ribosomal protein L21 [Bacteroidia bacterium]MDW8333742.1 50S ribosomal protein L21 [Bacteroidia bacterium]
MFAIIALGGRQIKAEPGRYAYVNRMPHEPDSVVQIDDVLMVVDGDQVRIGRPKVEGASVTVRINEHLKDDKIIVFKKKRRKGYKVKKGHRQHLTRITFESINF